MAPFGNLVRNVLERFAKRTAKNTTRRAVAGEDVAPPTDIRRAARNTTGDDISRREALRRGSSEMAEAAGPRLVNRGIRRSGEAALFAPVFSKKSAAAAAATPETLDAVHPNRDTRTERALEHANTYIGDGE